MQEWFSNNSFWVLITTASLVIFLLFFGEKFKNTLSRMAKVEKREKISQRISNMSWIIEAIFTIIMVGSLILLLTMENGGDSIITAEIAKEWMLGHGIAIIIILVVAIALWAVLKRFLPSVIKGLMARPMVGESVEGSKRRANTLIKVFLGLIKAIIVIVALLIVLSEMGVSVGPILAGFGVVGIAVGFGAQYLIRDLIAGVFILMENQYRIGDVVKIVDVSGTVEEVNLRKTVVRDIDGVVHHVPNGEIRISSNYARHFAKVNLNVSVSYNTDLDFAIAVINRTCKQMAEEEKWKKIFRITPYVLRVDKLGDSGVEIKIIGEVRPLEQWNVTGELRLRLKKAFDKEGIEIPYPHRKVVFENASDKDQNEKLTR